MASWDKGFQSGLQLDITGGSCRASSVLRELCFSLCVYFFLIDFVFVCFDFDFLGKGRAG